MNQQIFTALEYLKYLTVSKNRHGVHSPLVFDIIEKVFRNKQDKTEFAEIEKLRKELLKDSRTIKIRDYGAGSTLNPNKERKIADIAKNSAKSPSLGRIMHHLVEYAQSQNILELGTSLGLSSAYLASANPISKLYTLEGCPETAKIAQENFGKLKLSNIEIITGPFEETLQSTLDKVNSIDFAFFDGNHQYKPTIEYFEKCLKYAHENTVFVFDDIYWSEGMKKAWLEISKHPSVSHSIDIFFLGILFFKKNTQPLNFRIKF